MPPIREVVGRSIGGRQGFVWRHTTQHPVNFRGVDSIESSASLGATYAKLKTVQAAGQMLSGKACRLSVSLRHECPQFLGLRLLRKLQAREPALGMLTRLPPY
ncbi:hypothetical protein ACU8KH_00911 [Lachancea thermotolerans]